MKRRSSPLPAAVVLAAAVLGGCGGGTASAPPPTTTTPAVKPSTLTIKIHPGNMMGAKEHDYTLTCAPAGGTLPDAAKACARLSASVTLLAPTAECPIRVGDVGSQEVTGTWQGAPLALAFHGCAGDEDRWPKLAAALGL